MCLILASVKQMWYNGLNNLVKSYRQFIAERRQPLLYHGTSSKLVPEILKHGLLPGENGYIYVTTDVDTAAEEAYCTVVGDYSGAAGIGGDPVVLEIDRDLLPSMRWESDPEYYTGPIRTTHAFRTRKAIPATAIQIAHKTLRVPSWCQ